MSVNFNASRGSNGAANILAPSKAITKQSKWTDLFKDKRVLGGLTAAAGLTGYLVTRAGSTENIPQSSNSLFVVAVGAALIGVCTIANEFFNFNPIPISDMEIEKLINDALDINQPFCASYNNYAIKIQKYFPNFLSFIEKNEANYKQSDISRLFSNYIINAIIHSVHIQTLKDCINGKEPLNLMIREAVKQACDAEIKKTVKAIQRILISNKIVDKNLLQDILKTPNFYFIYNEVPSQQTVGLEIYKKLSSDLVMDQFKTMIEQENENHVLIFVKNLLENELIVRQPEDMKIPLNRDASILISKMIDKEVFYNIKNGLEHSLNKEKFYEDLENEFINYANGYFSIVLDSLHQFHERQLLEQKHFDLLFTEKFVQQLSEENIDELKEYLNEETLFNSMIFNTVLANCEKARARLTDEERTKKDLVNYFKLVPERLKFKLNLEQYEQISELAKNNGAALTIEDPVQNKNEIEGSSDDDDVNSDTEGNNHFSQQFAGVLSNNNNNNNGKFT